MGYALAFTGDRNRDGKKDFTGAFFPEACRYLDYAFSDGKELNSDINGLAEIPLSESPRSQRLQIVTTILNKKPTEVAFFCHGLTTSIELGFGNLTLDSLVNVLVDVGCSRVALHACLTGKKDAGFAAVLAIRLANHFPDVRVLGSTTSGHTSRNPHRRLFNGITPGEWIVHPTEPEWRAWTRRMRDANDPLRWQLLEKTRPEILKELRGE